MDVASTIGDEEKTCRAVTTMQPEPTMGWQPVSWMLSAAFCFATMGALAHLIGDRCDWLMVAYVRILCTFASTVAMVWLGGAQLVVLRPRTLWVRSIAGTISLVCSFYALAHLPVADVLTLTNTYPLWIVLLSIRKLKPSELGVDLICVCCGVAGVVLIQRPYLSGQGNLAVLVALGSSVTTAIAMLGLHRLRSVDARAVVAHFSGLASLILTAWIITHPPTLVPSSQSHVVWLLLLGVGLSGTAGQVLLTRAFAAGAPSRIAVLSLTQVVFAMIYDLVLQDRVFSWWTIVGFALVLLPTAWITLQAQGK